MATNSECETNHQFPNSECDSVTLRLQPGSSNNTANSAHLHASIITEADHPTIQPVIPSGCHTGLRLDSGFGSLQQPNSLNYGANNGGLPSIGAEYLPNLDQEDDAYESLQLSSMCDQLSSMGDFPTMDSFPSMGPLPTMGEFLYPNQLPIITESPPSMSEIDPQADGTHAICSAQDSVNDGHSNPMSSLLDSDNHGGQVESVVKSNSDELENAELDIQGHNPMRNEQSYPQLPSTLLSNVRSQPIEIPLREPVKQKPDYVLERVLVEGKV